MTWPLDCIRQNECLANHTSFRIGGPAEFFVEPSTIEELIQVVREAGGRGLPISVLGGGTNLLVPDRGIRGLVIHLGKTFRTTELLDSSDPSSARVQCGAGLSTHRLVMLAAQEGWGEMERLAGLPGQVGGAVAMNAQDIGRFVESVRLVSFEGELCEWPRARLQFSYRYTGLEPGIIVDIVFRFPKVAAAVAPEEIARTLHYRNSTQDLKLPSAGCAFKNPPGDSAGRLIDQAGLKGTRIGDAQVSHRHANFIMNLGHATCDDVLSLMEHIQRQVEQRFGIKLEQEVRLFGGQWSPTVKPVAPAPTPRVGRTSRPAARAGTANGAHGQDRGPTAGWDYAAAPRPSSRAGG